MRTAVATAVLVMLLAPAASAQTVPGQPRPPDAFLSSASGEVRGEIQFYCWSEPDGSGGFVAICGDNFNPIDPPQSLVVHQGEVVTLHFDRPIRPNSIRVNRSETSLSTPLQTFGVPADNPTQFRADFPPGNHIVTVSTTWPQGDAMYVFELTVLPSQPVVGGLSPEILAGIARVRETARLLTAGSAQFEQQLAAVFASADALTASLLDMVDEILGGAFTTVPSQPG